MASIFHSTFNIIFLSMCWLFQVIRIDSAMNLANYNMNRAYETVAPVRVTAAKLRFPKGAFNIMLNARSLEQAAIPIAARFVRRRTAINVRSLLVVSLVTALASLSYGAAAFAYCFEPSTPSIPSQYSKPTVPYCMNNLSLTGKHSCQSYEIESYMSEVKQYVRKMRDFADETRQYQSDAVAYAECEVRNVLEQHK